MKQVVLVDSKNQLYRAHYSPSLMHLSREDGFPTGAIYGNLNYVLLGVAKHLPEASFVWCWDGLGETWRHKLMASTPPLEVNQIEDAEETATVEPYQDFQAKMVTNTLSYLGFNNVEYKKKKKRKVYGYKANRAWTPTKHKTKYPTDEKERALIQIPVLKSILNGIGIRQFEIQSLEADDLIGILTKMLIDMDCEVYIFSGDRDFYQLLQHEQVQIIKSTKNNKLEYAQLDEIKAKFGIDFEDWTKFRAWTGDTSDNIGHIFKVGPVTARKMLAAGLDPSIQDVAELDKHVVEKFARYFLPHGIEKMWPSVHNNYKLCELVTDPASKLLSSEVRDRLHKALRDVKSPSDFRRNKAVNTTEAYRKLTFILAQYELASILAKRDELWNIP